jgi:hypothetical protein
VLAEGQSMRPGARSFAFGSLALEIAEALL